LRVFLRPVLLFSALGALAACAGATTSETTPPTFGAGTLQRTSGAPFSPPVRVGRTLHLAGHVYVGAQPNVFRYKVTNGVPASTPDLTIDTGGFGGPIAASDRGDVYAVSGSGGNVVIGVFAPGAKTPKRTVNVDPGCGIFPMSAAVDGRGDVFLSCTARTLRGTRSPLRTLRFRATTTTTRTQSI
jgi:hypothetical protein